MCTLDEWNKLQDMAAQHGLDSAKGFAAIMLRSYRKALNADRATRRKYPCKDTSYRKDFVELCICFRTFLRLEK